ncbi:MAG TPA: T9SS type A sorting domain-containing protein [Bacteroidetes bacterium]|nr:T9SS type A sorting domain-containing protein [Bacteroidota bacterium]
MYNKQFNILFSFILIVILNTISFAQNPVQKMIKRALKEKTFLKLGNENITKDSRISTNVYNYRNQYGERLVYDNEKGSESEMFAAINPLDSNNIVVSSIHFAYNQVIDQPMSISTYYSKDFGNTWQKSDFDGIVNPQNIVVGGGDPVLVFDANGDLHLTYIILAITDLINFKASEFIYHAISKDGGVTWESKPYFMSSEFSTASLEGIDRFLDKQWMVSDLTGSPYHGNVYLGYVDFFAGDTILDPSMNIKIDILRPGDTSFVYNPIKLTPDSFKFVQFTSVDLDKEGNLYIGFVGSLDSLDYYFYNSVSKDGGETFSEPRKISKFYYPGFTSGSKQSNIVGIKDRYFPSPYIALDNSDGTSSGRIYATWTAPGIDTIELTGSDIYLSYSDDKGITWVEPVIVNNDSLENSDQFYSNLEINSAGIPILCFYDKRQDTLNNFKTDYYITYSLETEDPDFSTQYPLTSQFSDFSKIGAKTNGFGIGEYNKTVSTGSFAIPFWSDGRKNTGDINIYMALIPLDGNEYTVGTYEINLVTDKINITGISPNPSNGIFSVNLNLKESSKLSFQLFDLNGKQMFSKKYNNNLKGKQELKLKINNINSGIYILKINSDFGFITRKIEILK